MTKHSLSIVIPAYNEEGNIKEVVLRSLEVLRALTDRYEVLVMDDASRDRTWEILSHLARRFPNQVRVFRHEKNKGTNLSLIELFRSAKNELVFFLPADKQILPEAIQKYIPFIESGEADVVLGWRRRRADPFYRLFFNWAYLMILRLLVGIRYHDACASDLYRKSVLDQIQMESWGRFLQAEIATKASLLGYRIKEIEVDHHPRVAGRQTGIKPKTAWLSFVDIIRLGLKLRKLKQEKRSKSAAVLLTCFFLLGCSRPLVGTAVTLYEFPKSNLDHVGGLAWSPDGEKILFHKLVKGEEIEKYTLFSIKDGSLVPLHIDVEDSQNFSPDGSKILFSDGSRIYEYDIHQAAYQKVPLWEGTDENYLLGAVYSPDGEEIAFCRGGKKIYMVPTRGGEAKQIAGGLEMAYWIRWSYDTKSLFIWLLAGPTVAKVDIATGEVQKIVKGDGVWPLADGKRIVYLDGRKIYLRNLESDKTALVSRETNVRDIALSRDGKKIAFVKQAGDKFFLKALSLPES